MRAPPASWPIAETTHARESGIERGKTMNTTHCKTNGLMAKLGLMAAIMAGGLMVGCAGTRGVVSEITKANTSAEGVMVIGVPLTVGRASAESICGAFPYDERCKNIHLYKGDTIQLAETSTLIGLAVKEVPVLVPASVDYPRRSLLKVRIKGDAPAYFEGIAAIGLGSEDCYRTGMFGRGTTGPGGVICPKYNYDYRNVHGLN